MIGHPKHDAPAYGWATLKRDGESLFAKFDDVNPSFEAGVAQGAYRNRSVAVVKDKQHGWRVRHIGWLGAAPPAIDGLKPVQFSAAEDAEAHEFASGDDERITGWALDDIAATLRAMREATIADKGLEEADRLLPEWRISSVSTAAAQLRELASKEATEDAPPRPMFTAPTPGEDHTMSLTPADLERAAQEAAAKAKAEAAAEFAAQAEELKKLKSERQGERIKLQITGWKAEGKLLPAQEAGLAEFMAAIEDGGFELTFAAPGTDTPAKKPAAEFFAEFMGRLAPQIKLGKQEDGGDPAPGQGNKTDAEVAAEARQFQAAEAAKGHTISIGQAIDHVTQRAAK
ncbi:hypothetical protein [Ideonella paludis]|uniref:hypothetical protein n=1 Tax=Ideonella paludis TaxID=1233411 RepID=UPI0036253093